MTMDDKDRTRQRRTGKSFPQKHGLHEMRDESGAQTNWQKIDTSKLKPIADRL